MEIITAAFATAVAAFCLFAIVSKDVKENKPSADDDDLAASRTE